VSNLIISSLTKLLTVTFHKFTVLLRPKNQSKPNSICTIHYNLQFFKVTFHIFPSHLQDIGTIS